MEKIRSSMVSPKDLFKTEEFKEWDEEGVPITMASGEAVSGGQIKKKKKAIEKQKKVYDDLMGKTDGNPQALVDATQNEVDELKEELARLSI